MCGSCRKRYDCDNCYQGGTPRDDAQRAQSSSPRLRRSSSTSSDDVAVNQWLHRRRSLPGDRHDLSVEDASLDIIPRVPFTTVVGSAIPSCSLPALFRVFDPASHGLSQPESSIISLTIPLTTKSKALFHAMTACSSIFLAQEQPSWHSFAIRHHCEAVRYLAQEIDGQRLSESEALLSCMAVVMMLHLFEVSPCFCISRRPMASDAVF